jgi:hypothetical protein
MYKQCHLVNGDIHQTAWIPAKYAQVGATVKIKKGSVWHDGWKIEFVGAETEDIGLTDMHKTLKGHRKHSDVAQGTFKK